MEKQATFLEEEDDFDEILNSPFNPKSISIKTKVISLDQVLRRIRQKTIRLAPGFQRLEVWDTKRSSRLIESLMLKIPLQMFYVSANKNDEWDVVDGLQRLTAIKSFMLEKNSNEKEFRLVDLEFWGEKFNNKTFSEIAEDPKNSQIINNIMETELNFTIIDANTPEPVKRNIFKRINTGGVPLTVQEIRHALYEGQSTDLLKELASSEIFLSVTQKKMDDKRMGAREAILRSLAFSLRDFNDYPGNLDTFLSDTMRVLNLMPILEADVLKEIFIDSKEVRFKVRSIEELKEKFYLGLKRGIALFEDSAFKKTVPLSYSILKPKIRPAPINKSLLEVWGVLLSELSEGDFKKLVLNKSKLYEKYKLILNESSEFERATSKDPARIPSVKTRYSTVISLINETINKDVEYAVKFKTFKL